MAAEPLTSERLAEIRRLYERRTASAADYERLADPAPGFVGDLLAEVDRLQALVDQHRTELRTSLRMAREACRDASLGGPVAREERVSLWGLRDWLTSRVSLLPPALPAPNPEFRRRNPRTLEEFEACPEVRVVSWAGPCLRRRLIRLNSADSLTVGHRGCTVPGRLALITDTTIPEEVHVEACERCTDHPKTIYPMGGGEL